MEVARTLIRTFWFLQFRGETPSVNVFSTTLTNVSRNLELLSAARKYSKALKHFCFTGSIVSVTDVTKPFSGRALTTNDWNEVLFASSSLLTVFADVQSIG